VLSLNTHANVPPAAVSQLLQAAKQLRVLELGGSTHTRSLYFQVKKILEYKIFSTFCHTMK
jgi:hypothetical protein